MRQILCACLVDMKSPIRHVFHHIHEAIVNVAPERKEQFDKEHDTLILEYLDTFNWICHTDPDAKYIQLSRRVVEIFWVASYAYITFYSKVIQVVKPTKKQYIDLTQNEDVAKAMRLLKWGYENLVNKEDIPWPDDLPRPIPNPEQGSMENVADELCLFAVAFVLHHELAHIRLEHSASNGGVELERETDYAASDWILNHDLSEKDMKFIKRGLGIAIAFEVMTAYGIYTGKYGGKTHPYSYDRLVHTLRRYISDPDHLVWALLVSTIKLHLDNKKIAVPDVIYESFYECVNAYADVLSRQININAAS